MKVGIIGAGRIGKVHAKNISMFVPEMEIKTIADPFANDATREFAAQYHIPNVTTDAADILEDPEIEAVLICSSTDTHSHFIIEAAKAKKHIFCEKPIDYDLNKVHEAINAAKDAGVKLQIGFCRRFDHNHRAVYDMVQQGKVGKVNLIKVSSRDPEPPPVSYVKVSGGIFYDMMIHDFDMAMFLAGCDVTEVYAMGTSLVDPRIGQAGDVDTAIVTLTFANGALGVIDNSRRAAYGYDQRVEVFGSLGMAADENDGDTTVRVSTAGGVVSDKPQFFFLERYMGSFIAEMRQFIDAIVNDGEVPVGIHAGLMSVVLAKAAKKSLDEHRPVKIAEILEA